MNPDEMSREQLVNELEAVRELIELRGADSPDEATLEDIWIAGLPVGMILDNARKQSKKNAKKLSEASNGSVSAKGHKNREHLNPLHKMWIDVRDGVDDSPSNASVRRAAVVFHEILLKATGNSRAAVSVTPERYLVKATDAKQPILEHDDSVESLSSQQVKRAFEQAQMLTRDDCDCDELHNCEHGLVVARFEDDPNTLTADREAVLNYLERLDQLDGASVGGADDSGETDEDTADARAEADDALARLDEAQSNAGVSAVDATALDRDAAADGGTQPR